MHRGLFEDECHRNQLHYFTGGRVEIVIRYQSASEEPEAPTRGSHQKDREDIVSSEVAIRMDRFSQVAQENFRLNAGDRAGDVGVP